MQEDSSQKHGMGFGTRKGPERLTTLEQAPEVAFAFGGRNILLPKSEQDISCTLQDT